MLDALLPAMDAGERGLARGADAGRRHRHATAAETGATATIPLLATKGRASYLGDRSIGHQDPGRHISSAAASSARRCVARA